MSQDEIDPTFRNGSITAVGVVVGFSLGFLSRWAALPGQWTRADLIAVACITVGIASQVKALTDLLGVRSLERPIYERCVRYFISGVVIVAVGVVMAIFAEILGYGSMALKG
jgi:uncharacterized membrane protein YiaA